MTTLARPPCDNHPDATAVAVIHSGDAVERFVCITCADRFWQLANVVGGPAATLTYL